jgi:hypothetical protein
MTVGGGEIIGGAGVISTEEYHRRQKLTEVMRCFDIIQTLNIGYSCVKLNQWLLGVES